MTRKNRLASLYRRLAWLKKRVGEANVDGRQLTYDQAEIEALEWAIPILEREVERPAGPCECGHARSLHDETREPGICWACRCLGYVPKVATSDERKVG